MKDKYQGMTNEYRETEEYKFLVKETLKRHPNMNLYLVEMAIDTHKSDPQYYKKLNLKKINEQFKAEKLILEYNDMKIYNNPEDFPEDFKEQIKSELNVNGSES